MASEALKPNPTVLREIIERLERLEGPDREADTAIMGCFYVREKRHIGTMQDEGRGWEPCLDEVWVDPDQATDTWVSTHAKNFTASLDAAVALVEKVLPGWVVAALSNGTLDPKYRDVRLYTGWRASLGRIGAEITPETVSGQDFATGTAPNPAIALLLALFKALEQKP